MRGECGVQAQVGHPRAILMFSSACAGVELYVFTICRQLATECTVHYELMSDHMLHVLDSGTQNPCSHSEHATYAFKSEQPQKREKRMVSNQLGRRLSVGLTQP